MYTHIYTRTRPVNHQYTTHYNIALVILEPTSSQPNSMSTTKDNSDATAAPFPAQNDRVLQQPTEKEINDVVVQFKQRFDLHSALHTRYRLGMVDKHDPEFRPDLAERFSVSKAALESGQNSNVEDHRGAYDCTLVPYSPGRGINVSIAQEWLGGQTAICKLSSWNNTT